MTNHGRSPEFGDEPNGASPANCGQVGQAGGSGLGDTLDGSQGRPNPVFFVGALLYLYRDRIPDSGWLAFGSAAVFIGCLWLPFGNAATYAFLPTVSAAVLFSPFLAYPMIWAGIHLPFHWVGARNDYSYGTYVYAWPVQQLLAIWGVQRWGMPTYMVLSVVGTVSFAVASWWLVEKHALRLKRIAPKRLLQWSSVS